MMSVHQFQLAPDGNQRKHLNQVFTGPELLLNLLKSEKNIPKNRSDVGLFLLKNKSLIYPYICENMRDNVDALHDVIYNFIVSKNKGPRVDFLTDCSISEESFYFPVKKLGLIKATAEGATTLKSVRKGKRYVPGFSLIKINNDFFVEIQFELSNYQNSQSSIKLVQKQINPKKSNTSETKKQKSSSKKVVYTATYGSGQSNLSKIDKLIRFVESGAVGKDLSNSFTYNWGGGSIWTLPGGGGPGTGKKR